jgi:peptidoglycan/LPS O-acetylase OafA/YrhL
MLPCWLAGVLLYYHRPVFGARTAASIFAGSILAYLIVFQFDLPMTIRRDLTVLWPNFMHSLGFSNLFVGDYMIAVIVAVNFSAIINLGAYGSRLLAVRQPIAIVAAHAFSIYLYHMPLLVLLAAGFHLPFWGASLALFACIAVLGQLTERNLPRFRAALGRLAFRTAGRDVV